MKKVSFKETCSLLKYNLSDIEKEEKQKCYRNIRKNIFKNQMEYELEQINKNNNFCTLIFHFFTFNLFKN